MNKFFLLGGVILIWVVLVSAISIDKENIDTSGFSTTGCETGYSYCKNSEFYNTSIKSDPTSNDAIKVEKNGKYIVMKPSEIFFTDGEAEEGTVVVQSSGTSLRSYEGASNLKVHYEDAFGEGIHLEYVWTRTRLLKLLVVDSKNDLPEVNYSNFNVEELNLVFNEQFELSPDLDVYIDGKKWDMEKKITTDKAVLLKYKNETIMKIPQPFLMDVNEKFYSITYTLSKKSGKLKIALNVPYEILADAAYPIVIDPTVDTGVLAATATSYSSQRKIVRNSTGQIHVVYNGFGGANYANSTDNGATWVWNQVISGTCNNPAIDINVTGELLVVCEADDSYISYPPHIAAWVSTTGGGPPPFGFAPDIDVDNVTGNATVADTDGTFTLEYFEAASPYNAWTMINPGGGIAPVNTGSVDVALNFTGTEVCIGYQDDGGLQYMVTCCYRGAGNCSTDANAWSTPVAMGTSNTAAGSCAFDENGNITCAFIDNNMIYVSTVDIASMTLTETTQLDPGNKLTCTSVSLSVYNSTEQYLSASCYDATRGVLNDIFVANRSTIKHWGYPQKETTYVDILDDLLSPSSPSFFNISDSVFEWIYTNSSAGAYTVDYDNTTWSQPQTSYCGSAYNGGDWLVVNPTLCENETIWLDNESTLTINDQLVFNNVTLKVSGFEDGDDTIIVNSGGEFLINNTYNYSVIEPGYCTSCYYVFNVEDGGMLSINGSSVTYAGYSTSYADPFRYTGLWINSSSVWIDNATISSLAGLSFYGSATYGLSNIFVNNTVLTASSRHGVYAYNISNSAFNLITATSPVTRDGIRLTTGSENNIIENSTIDSVRIYNSDYNLVKNVSASGNSAGIVLVSDSNYNNITNNTAHTAGLFHGINLDNGCDYNIIDSNIVHSNPQQGIYLHTNNDYNNITNNTVYENIVYGILLDAGENNNIIENNDAYNNTDNINIYLSDSNTIRNNTIHGNTTAVGIQIQNSDYISLYNNTVNESPYCITSWIGHNCDYESNYISNCTYGIALFHSYSNTFLNHSIDNCYVSVNFTNSSTGTLGFANSTITNTLTTDVGLDTGSNLTMINVTFNKSNSNIVDTSQLTVRWYVDAQTVYSDYTAFPNVLVRIVNTTGNQVFWGTSDATGYITRREITEYEETAAGQNSWNNYTFSGEFQTYGGSNITNISTNDVGSVYIVMTPGGGGGGGGTGTWNPTFDMVSANETEEPEIVAAEADFPWWLLLIPAGAFVLYRISNKSETRKKKSEISKMKNVRTKRYRRFKR